MKTLFIMRHAKSSWDEPEMKDFARPLAARGLEDIPTMAARFTQRAGVLDAIVCSPARRTEDTARLFAEQIGLTTDRVSCNSELYFAGAPMLLRAVSLFDDTWQAAMLVGHNPAITDFVNSLAVLEIDSVPTAGLLQFELDVARWSEVTLGAAQLIEFDFPKRQPS